MKAWLIIKLLDHVPSTDSKDLAPHSKGLADDLARVCVSNGRGFGSAALDELPALIRNSSKLPVFFL